jgi:hydrogenase/urease accessory protein HupE
MRMRALCVVVMIVLGAAGAAQAHQVGLSRGAWVQSQDSVQAELVFARGEALALCPALDANSDRSLDDDEVARALPLLRICVVDGVTVESDGAACAGEVAGASLTEEDGFAVRATFACKRAGRTTVDLTQLLTRASTEHRHLGRVTTVKGDRDVVAFSASPAFSFGEESPEPPVSAYLRIGVEHILFGFDHLVFLLGLVLVGGRLRALVAVVTAFTLAHSVSLALAVLGVVAVSASVVEPLIALSIAYVGVENFFVKDAAKRWRITAPFGLVHGFGFAGALAEVGVPKDAVAPALLLFNVGVELGQLGVLVLVLPVLALLARRAPRAHESVKRALSCAIVAAGLYWLIERVLFSR